MFSPMEAQASAAPSTWATMAFTSQWSHTVEAFQSAGARPRSSAVKRWYSVAASCIASSCRIGGIVRTLVVVRVMTVLPRLAGGRPAGGFDVGEEHVDGGVHQTDPAVAAGVVGDLLGRPAR